MTVSISDLVFVNVSNQVKVTGNITFDASYNNPAGEFLFASQFNMMIIEDFEIKDEASGYGYYNSILNYNSVSIKVMQAPGGGSGGDTGDTSGGTPVGVVSAPTFSGTPSTPTGNIAAPTFSGTPGTPTGNASSPTFSGTPGTPTGNNASSAVTGTADAQAWAAGAYTPSGTNGTSAVTGTADAQAFTGNALGTHAHNIVITNAVGTYTLWRTYISAVVGVFLVGETVGDGLGNTAVVSAVTGSHLDFNAHGGAATFQAGAPLTGGTSAATATADSGLVGVVTPASTPFFITGANLGSGVAQLALVSTPNSTLLSNVSPGVTINAANLIEGTTLSGDGSPVDAYSITYASQAVSSTSAGTPSGTNGSSAINGTAAAQTWTGNAAALTGTNTASAINGTAAAQTWTGSPFTPTGGVSAPAITMNPFTPTGNVSVPVLTMNPFTPAGNNSVPSFTGSPLAVHHHTVGAGGGAGPLIQVPNGTDLSTLTVPFELLGR